MSMWPEHLAGYTSHARRGVIRNAFRYGVDYILIDPDSQLGPALFSRNRFNLNSVDDRAHGGPPGAGRGVEWARRVLAGHGMPKPLPGGILLLTQPRFLGYLFNPVSFWLVIEDRTLRAVIAEVNNTFGDRHCYLCHKAGFAPIDPADQITATKIFHVSPFQEIAGHYRFNFRLDDDRIAIRIAHENGAEGVIATLTGKRRPLTNRAILAAAVRRPFGSLRTIALIHWQAARLKLKGARFRARPAPPTQEVT